MDAQKKFEALRKKDVPLDAIWTELCADKLLGRTVKAVRYMTDDEAEANGWYQKPLIIIFDDESFIVPMQDDEGNDGGSLFTGWPDLPTIPVIRCMNGFGGA